MRNIPFIFFIGLTLLLFGCESNTNSGTAVDDQNVEFTKLASHSINQHSSNQAKELLSKHDAITSINAVNSTKDLVVAIEVHHNKRFQLAKLEKKYEKELKKKFPQLNIALTSDKKIIFELDQLEKKIKANDISNKELKKQLNHIKNLMKEQT